MNAKTMWRLLPLSEIIFKSCLESCTFPLELKKTNVIPVHKKGDKLSSKYYHPILLLHICGKISERLIYNKMFEYFIESNLFARTNQGFNLEIHVLSSCFLFHMRFIS